jgi:hypothetical protein
MDGTGVRFEGRAGGGSMGRRRRRNEGGGASFIAETITKRENSPVCVEAILYELLDDAHRTLHHLTGGYAIDHLLG